MTAATTGDATPLLRIGLLGPPDVTWAGQPVALARRQARALLYRLAAANGPVGRDALGELLWPDAGDPSTRRALTRLLTHLRAGLPDPEAILASEDHLALRPERCWTDVAEFGRLTTVPRGGRQPDAEALERAAALHRGPFLDGFALPDSVAYDDWLAEVRRVWERRYLDALAALIEARAAAGERAAAIAAAERALALDPLAEELHRRLIALYAEAGDRAAALRQYERCAAILRDELGVEPMPETRALAAALRARGTRGAEGDEQKTPRPPRPPAQPPSSPSSLIGREREVETALAMLRRADVRLLTLSGPGGAGKTRLGLHLAGLLREEFPDGVAFVPLAPVRDPGRVVAEIARALGLEERPDRPARVAIREYLGGRRVLLLLDNFEHVAAAAGEVGAVLASAPGVKALVTSRALLRLSQEHRFTVPPLALPPLSRGSRVEGRENESPSLDPGPSTLDSYPAVRLFVERVRQLDPAFVLTAENGPVVAEICRRLDGLPLAIELAAARTRLLSPAEILARLGRRLDLLTGGAHDLPPRQRTLRTTIAWSYDLLAPEQQTLFARLAVFAGGFSIEGAEAVWEGDEGGGLMAAGGRGGRGVFTSSPSSSSVVDALTALLDQHLIERAEGVAGSRFALLETIREFALERLAERGEVAAAREAHATYCLTLAERAEGEWRGPAQVSWLDRLEEEFPNLREALSWLIAAGDAEPALRLAAALEWFWYVRGHASEGRTWLDRALALVRDEDAGAGGDDGEASVTPLTRPLARAGFVAGRLAAFQGDYAVAREWLTASIARWRALAAVEADPRSAERGIGLAITYLVLALYNSGDREGAAALVPEWASFADRPGRTQERAEFLFGSGRGALHMGDYGRARALLDEARAVFADRGDQWFLAQSDVDLGSIALADGDAAAARAAAESALAIARAVKDRTLETFALANLGEAARYVGDDEMATAAYAECLELDRKLGHRADVPRLLHNQGYLALHRDQRDAASALFHESLARFREIGLARGVAEAIAGLAAVAAAGGTEAEAARAARFWGAAEAIYGRAGMVPWPADIRERERYLPPARARLTEAAFAAARAAGRALSLDEAAAEALGFAVPVPSSLVDSV
jgi:predicted ATPase/DNA-binding SARP family transcriptional activator